MALGSVQPPEVQDTTSPALQGDIKVTSSVPPPPCSLFKPILLPPSVPASGSREHQIPEKCWEKGEEGDSKNTPPLAAAFQVVWEHSRAFRLKKSSCPQGKSSCPQDLSVPRLVCKFRDHTRSPWEPFKWRNNPCWTNTLLGELSQGCPSLLKATPAQVSPPAPSSPQPSEDEGTGRSLDPYQLLSLQIKTKQTAFIFALISSPCQHHRALPATFQHPQAA